MITGGARVGKDRVYGDSDFGYISRSSRKGLGGLNRAPMSQVFTQHHPDLKKKRAAGLAPVHPCLIA